MDEFVDGFEASLAEADALIDKYGHFLPSDEALAHPMVDFVKLLAEPDGTFNYEEIPGLLDFAGAYDWHKGRTLAVQTSLYPGTFPETGSLDDICFVAAAFRAYEFDLSHKTYDAAVLLDTEGETITFCDSLTF